MGKRLFGILEKSAVTTLLAGALLLLGSPVAALAQGHGTGHAGGRSLSGNARGFSGGGRAVYGGRGYGGGYYRGGGYYDGGFSLGFGVPYAYGPGYGYAPVPAPCGYYDQAGYWHAAPGCYSGGPVY